MYVLIHEKLTPKMASSGNGNTANTDNVVHTHRAEIEAVQTVPPSKITAPRTVRQVLSTSDVSGVSGGCLHVVLYYNKASDQGDSGSLHAGWIKESLAGALSEQPLLAGRLQKGEINDNNIVDEEAKNIVNVVSNDAGVRLIEARIGATMAEFLLETSMRKEAEAELVFWKHIDQVDPQFCPLFYVQVYVCR